ncbi:MAG: FAD-binding protein [Slackia sp.]
MLYDSAVENGANSSSTPTLSSLWAMPRGITGVIASTKDGKNIQYDGAKAVILATGDIGGNQEMIDAFAPIANRADANTYTPEGCNTGDGVLMGCWAGAALQKSTAAPMIHQFTADSLALNLTSFIMCWLAVDSEGKRYGAEMPFEPMLTNARMNTPGNVAWSLFDADYPTYVQKQQATRYDRFMDGVEDIMADWEQKGTLVKADTIEELAEKIDVPAENLKATIERYNELAASGDDVDFGVPANFLAPVQTAPFYATKNVCSLLTIPFGLHVNAESQVLTEDDKVIKGLYAIGNVQGDFFGDDYPVHFPGVSHGRCVTFGELVGQAIAKDTVISEADFE